MWLFVQARGRDHAYNYGSLTGAGVSIYIVDTGVYLNHPEFRGASGSSRAQWGADCTTGTCYTAFPPAEAGAANGDCAGHGTHCAGTAAGRCVRPTVFVCFVCAVVDPSATQGMDRMVVSHRTMRAFGVCF